MSIANLRYLAKNEVLCWLDIPIDTKRLKYHQVSI